MKQLASCPIRCWITWKSSFPTTLPIISANNGQSKTASVSVEVIFFSCLLRSQSPFQGSKYHSAAIGEGKSHGDGLTYEQGQEAGLAESVDVLVWKLVAAVSCGWID